MDITTSFRLIKNASSVALFTGDDNYGHILSIQNLNSSGNEDNKVVNAAGTAFYNSINSSPFPYSSNVDNFLYAIFIISILNTMEDPGALIVFNTNFKFTIYNSDKSNISVFISPSRITVANIENSISTTKSVYDQEFADKTKSIIEQIIKTHYTVNSYNNNLDMLDLNRNKITKYLDDIFPFYNIIFNTIGYPTFGMGWRCITNKSTREEDYKNNITFQSTSEIDVKNLVDFKLPLSKIKKKEFNSFNQYVNQYGKNVNENASTNKLEYQKIFLNIQTVNQFSRNNNSVTAFYGGVLRNTYNKTFKMYYGTKDNVVVSQMFAHAWPLLVIRDMMFRTVLTNDIGRNYRYVPFWATPMTEDEHKDYMLIAKNLSTSIKTNNEGFMRIGRKFVFDVNQTYIREILNGDQNRAYIYYATQLKNVFVKSLPKLKTKKYIDILTVFNETIDKRIELRIQQNG